MKTQLKQPIQAEVSSIKSLNSEHDNTQSDVELEQINMAQMNFHDYYSSTDPLSMQLTQFEGERYVQDLLKKLLSNTQKQISENELIRKLPIIAVQSSLSLIYGPIVQRFHEPEDPTDDIESGGLVEDIEPGYICKEQWLTAKVNVEIQKLDNTDNTTNRQSVSAMTFMRSKVFTAEQNATRPQQKQLDPIQIDLTDPLDISMTEEQLRNQKEKQVKEKQELREAENRRRIKEEKEEQLKYEMMAKDKKSKLYTYDYDGKLISVNLAKTHKLPQSQSTLNSQFVDDGTKQNVKKKYQAIIPPIKKKGDDDKDNQKFQILAPLVVENMNLQLGVAVTLDGRIREGPKPSTVDLDNMNNPNLRMARNEYLSLTQQINTNRSQSNTMVAKAEDKPIRELQTQQSFNIEKLKRLGQGYSNSMGGIKINSTKIFETVAQTIFEEDEFPIRPEKTPKTIIIEQSKSPIDIFNMNIFKNSNQTKEIINGQATYDKLKGLSKNKDVYHSKPRDREPIQLPRVKN